VNPGTVRGLDRFPTPVDGVDVGVGKDANNGLTDFASDRPDCFKVPGGGNRESGFDDVNLQFFELAGDFYFLVDIETAPGGLFTVAKRRVEYYDSVHAGFLVAWVIKTRPLRLSFRFLNRCCEHPCPR
jgi:hypothetical protein